MRILSAKTDPTIRIIKKGMLFRDFKGEYYYIITLAKHPETTGPMVVYKNIKDNKIYSLPAILFVAEIDKERYPNAIQDHRYECCIYCELGEADVTEDPKYIPSCFFVNLEY